MIGQVKGAIQQIEKLPESKQIEIAKLIQDELSWDTSILQSQDQLGSLAKEALKEYNEGKTSHLGIRRAHHVAKPGCI
jgi:hypothetical protein